MPFAVQNGGAIDLWGSSAELSWCTLSGNSATHEVHRL